MVTEIDAKITYIESEELNYFTEQELKNGDLTINDIRLTDVRSRDVVAEANILILKHNGKYKILKSRY